MSKFEQEQQPESDKKKEAPPPPPSASKKGKGGKGKAGEETPIVEKESSDPNTMEKKIRIAMMPDNSWDLFMEILSLLRYVLNRSSFFLR
jgi:hypothetical protein